jgi:hypothetical protein
MVCRLEELSDVGVQVRETERDTERQTDGGGRERGGGQRESQREDDESVPFRRVCTMCVYSSTMCCVVALCVVHTTLDIPWPLYMCVVLLNCNFINIDLLPLPWYVECVCVSMNDTRDAHCICTVYMTVSVLYL